MLFRKTSKAILDFEGQQKLLSSNSKDCLATWIDFVEKKKYVSWI
jgi:hypothetical protein